jgi:hypothetical protein
MAVADHQPPATLVTLGRVCGQVVVDLGFQGGSQHPLGTLTHQLVQIQAQLIIGLSVGDYTQHAALLPRRRSPRRRFQDLSSGKLRRAHISRPNPQLQVIPLSRCPNSRLFVLRYERAQRIQEGETAGLGTCGAAPQSAIYQASCLPWLSVDPWCCRSGPQVCPRNQWPTRTDVNGGIDRRVVRRTVRPTDEQLRMVKGGE